MFWTQVKAGKIQEARLFMCFYRKAENDDNKQAEKNFYFYIYGGGDRAAYFNREHIFTYQK